MAAIIKLQPVAIKLTKLIKSVIKKIIHAETFVLTGTVTTAYRSKSNKYF